MDITGIAIITISAILYFATRKKETLQGWMKASLIGVGIGLGIIIGAIWAYYSALAAFGRFMQ